MAEEVGVAYVSILPSLKGFSRRVRAELKKQFARPVEIPVTVDKRQVTKEARAAGATARKAVPPLDLKARTDRAQVAKTAKEAGRAANRAVPKLELAADRIKLRAEATEAAGFLRAVAQAQLKQHKLQLPVKEEKGDAAKSGRDASETATRAAGPIRLKTDLDRRSLRGVRRRLRGFFQILGGVPAARGAVILSLGISLAAATPAMARFVAAAAPALGIVAALPAAIAGTVVAFGTLKLALSGVGDALKAGFKGDVEKFQEALEKLSPAARRFAEQLVALKPRLDALKHAVQDQFFKTFAGEFFRLANTVLPALQARLPGVAASLGQFAAAFARTARSAVVINALNILLEQVRRGVAAAAAGVGPMTRALAQLIAVAAPGLASMGAALARLAGRFGAFIDRTAKSGQLKTFLTDAVTALRQLGQIAFNVSKFFGGLFGALSAGSESTLGNLVRITAAMADFVSTGPGAEGLRTVFAGLSALGTALGDVLQALAPAFGQLFVVAAPVIGPFVKAVAGLAQAIAPVIPFVAQLLAIIDQGLTAAISALVGPLSQVVAVLVGALQPVLPVVSKLFATLAPIVVTIANVLGKVLVAVLGALAPLFAELLPVIGELVGAVLPALIPIVEALGSILLALIPILKPIIKLLVAILVPVLKLLVPVIGFVAKIIGVFVTALAWLIGWILKGITAVIEWIDGTDDWKAGAKVIGEVFSAIGDIIGAVVGWLINTAWPAIQGFASRLATAFGIIVAPVVTAFTAVYNAVVGFIGGVVAFFRKWWPLLLVIFLPVVAVLVAIWNRFGEAIIGGVTAVWNQVLAFLTAIWGGIKLAARLAWRGIQVGIILPVQLTWERIKAIWALVRAGLAITWAAIKAAASLAWNSIKSVIINPVVKLYNQVRDLFNKAKTAVTNSLTEAYNKAREIGGKFASIGKAIIDGIISGLANANSRLVKKLREIAESALKSAKKFLGIASPSKLFIEVGHDVGAGLVRGLDDSRTPVATAAAQLLTPPTASAFHPPGTPSTGVGINVENLEVKAFTDSFRLKQVQDELALHGVA
ncbi:MAG: hypothetical protein ACRDSK_13655 [Actinophytocola sp.]|uniref:hypothetical protein n=1 Tax=Actinophytocola sp. TaxID=1872138 RepID=UPI003D6A4198